MNDKRPLNDEPAPARPAAVLQLDSPCPFCGDAHPVLDDFFDEVGNEQHWIMVCEGCGAAGPFAETAEKAIEAWNQRRPLQ